MADEKTQPPKTPKGAETPAPSPTGEGTGVSPLAKPSADAPSKPADGPHKPIASPAKAAAPKASVKPDPWQSPLLNDLQKKLPGAVGEAVIFRNQPSVNVEKDQLVSVCQFLRSRSGGAYTMLTDETATDYPKREKRFDVIYHLYSFERNDRLRLRVQVGGDEPVPSVVSVWAAANWMEREIFDLFGIVFDGHPNLKRLLLPDEWVGHPLRKDYDILRQDDAWVKAHLGIESGQ